MHRKKIIKHVAIIMDGNGRWGLKRKLKRSDGHQAGVENCINLLLNLDNLDFNVKNISLYVFSTENWNRPIKEVKSLFNLIEKYYLNFKDVAIERNLKIRHLGSRKKIPLKLMTIIDDVIQTTENNVGTSINLAFNYGSRAEIIESINKINKKEITEQILSKNLYIHDLDDPEIIIRTGGEIRLSNFLLWQSAYSELFFTNTLWPNFKISNLNKILIEYHSRKRKYGQ